MREGVSAMNRIRTRLERLERARVEALDADIRAEARRAGLSDSGLDALAAEVQAMSDEELLVITEEVVGEAP